MSAQGSPHPTRAAGLSPPRAAGRSYCIRHVGHKAGDTEWVVRDGDEDVWGFSRTNPGSVSTVHPGPPALRPRATLTWGIPNPTLHTSPQAREVGENQGPQGTRGWQKGGRESQEGCRGASSWPSCPALGCWKSMSSGLCSRSFSAGCWPPRPGQAPLCLCGSPQLRHHPVFHGELKTPRCSRSAQASEAVTPKPAGWSWGTGNPFPRQCVLQPLQNHPNPTQLGCHCGRAPH